MDDQQIEDSAGREDQDRLSELPKSLILLILSLLPMRDVVSTTILSKSWENLWTTVPCLNFCFDIREEDEGIERFRNFVNRALILWEGTHILKFEIVIECYFGKSLVNDMDLWVKFAVRHNVEELNIHLCCDKEDLYRVPRCLISCSSIRKLSLVGCSLQIHGSLAWNQLKCLKMKDSCFSEQLINQILLSTPLLEVFDLLLWESNENLTIESSSLKKLSIAKYLYYDRDNRDELSLDAELKICCPNLETLEISGILYCKCLLSNVSSLTDATIGFRELRNNDAAGNELLAETLRQILPSIQHIERLTLSVWCIEVLDEFLKKYLLSPLLNIKFLKLDIDGRIGLPVIMNLLGIFPNLKTLVIEDRLYTPPELDDHLHDIPFVDNAPDFIANKYLEFETNLSKSILGQLKRAHVTSYFSHISTFQIIEFLLEHACELEKLVIQAIFSKKCGRDSCPQTCSTEFANVLLNIPRTSPTAEVVFKTGDY